MYVDDELDEENFCEDCQSYECGCPFDDEYDDRDREIESENIAFENDRAAMWR